MNILKLHNHYRLLGGESHSASAEASLLAAAGHTVVLLTADNSALTPLRACAAGVQSPWNWSTYRRVRTQIRQIRPDLLAVHNFFPLLSPAVYYAARAEGVAVVQSLHNYRILCPAATLFRDGHICESCIGRAFPWPALLNRCYRQSFAATTCAATTHAAHRWLGTWVREVDMYIAPSQFVRNKFLEAGFPEERIAVKPNFLAHDPLPGDGSGGFALFVGRLAQEKGIVTLLEAWRRLGKLRLVVAGDGPFIELVSAQHPEVGWAGLLAAEQVFALMKQAAVLICPSEWPEPFGRVIIEAFACGTPVIASRIGALPELVDHGRTGLLFRPGDPEDLADKIDWFFSHPVEARAMRREARAEFEAKYTAERNYPLLMEIYDRAIRHRRGFEQHALAAAANPGRAG